MKEEKDETSQAKRTEGEWKKKFSFDRRESTWTGQERRAEPNDGRPDTGKEEGKDRERVTENKRLGKGGGA